VEGETSFRVNLSELWGEVKGWTTIQQPTDRGAVHVDLRSGVLEAGIADAVGVGAVSSAHLVVTT